MISPPYPPPPPHLTPSLPPKKNTGAARPRLDQPEGRHHLLPARGRRRAGGRRGLGARRLFRIGGRGEAAAGRRVFLLPVLQSGVGGEAVRVRLEVALREAAGNCNKEKQGKKEEEKESDWRRDSKRRRSRLKFFFLSSGQASLGPNLLFTIAISLPKKLHLHPQPFPPPSFFHNDRRSHPPDHLHGLCRQARARQGRQSEREASARAPSGGMVTIDEFELWLFLPLSFSDRGRREEASQKKAKESLPLCPRNGASSVAWLGSRLSHSLETNVALSPVHCMRHSEPKNDPARGHERSILLLLSLSCCCCCCCCVDARVVVMASLLLSLSLALSAGRPSPLSRSSFPN